MSRALKVALIVAIAVAVLTVTLLATPGSAAEEAAQPTATPSPSTTATPSLTPTPRVASDLLVSKARALRRHFYRDLAKTNRALACFGLAPRHLSLPQPRRMALAGEWLAARRYWRRLVEKQHARFAALRYRMTHPCGIGAERWRPLVRWHWPASLVGTAMRVLALESGGDCRARNQSSGAAGLFQLYPAPDRWADPDYNVWAAYHLKYVPSGGWGPWYSLPIF